MTGKVIVIGAGIAGACCAGWLQRKGFEVTIVDRKGIGEETSFGNAGSINPYAVMPVAMPGMVKQIPQWLMDPLGPLTLRWSYLPRALPWLVRFLKCANPEQAQRTAAAMGTLTGAVFESYAPLVEPGIYNALIKRQGCLYVYDSESVAESDKGSVALRRSLGATLEPVGEGDIRQLEPGLSRIFKSGMFAPDATLTINPQKLTQAIVERVTRDGGTFLRTSVTAIGSGADGRPVLQTENGPMAADAVVLAAGAWSHQLSATAGERVPLESQRGYHVTIADSGIEARRMVAWVGRRVFATPMDVGLRVAGTVEIAGLTAKPNWDRADALLTIAKEMFPDLNTANVSRWMGHRPCLPDSLPVIGPSRKVPGLYYAFGHQHVGMCSAAATGRTVAEIVAGEKPQIDIAPFRVDRF
jgi:D-amino-acid dehydrogenase